MKILGYDFKVIVDGDRDMIGVFGRCHQDKQLIQIAEGLNEQQIETTMLHEVLEALNYYLQLSMSHDALMALEAGLYQTLTANGVDLGPLVKEARGGG